MGIFIIMTKKSKEKLVLKGSFYKLTQEDKLNIVNLYSSGARLKDLAQKYHISAPNLKKLLTNMGVSIRAVRYSKELLDIIINLWKNTSLTITDLSTRLNITPETLKKILTNTNKEQVLQNIDIECLITEFKNNNNLCKRKCHNQGLKDKVIDLYQNSDLYSFQIMKILNVSKSNLNKWTRGLKRIANQDESKHKKYFYDKWVDEYGKEKADEMMSKIKEGQSKRSSGKNNHSYGKVSHQRSGCGWKGWYKDHYFRSLREVAYMIYLDENNIPWISAEKKSFEIKYVNWDGADRTYRPDFLINEKNLIEIKPKRLHKSPTIMAKTKAALVWAAENGFTYEIIDFKIDGAKILAALNEGLIKFDRDYEEKFINWVSIKKK